MSKDKGPVRSLLQDGLGYPRSRKYFEQWVFSCNPNVPVLTGNNRAITYMPILDMILLSNYLWGPFCMPRNLHTYLFSYFFAECLLDPKHPGRPSVEGKEGRWIEN